MPNATHCIFASIAIALAFFLVSTGAQHVRAGDEANALDKLHEAMLVRFLRA
jgi:hypothetical protein